MARTEAPRFDGPWSTPWLSLLLGSTDPPDADIYSPGYCRYPYGPYHLVFLSIYNRAQDTVDVQLAVSSDGKLWDRTVPHTVVGLTAPEEGQPPYGSLYVAPGLHPLDENTWGVPYVAHVRRHNLWNPQQWLPSRATPLMTVIPSEAMIYVSSSVGRGTPSCPRPASHSRYVSTS